MRLPWPTPDRDFPDKTAWAPLKNFPAFSLSSARNNISRREFTINSGDYRYPLTSSLYQDIGYTFDVGHYDVIPLYDQLYRITIDSDPETVRLRRITEKVLPELRPGLKTRTISAAAVDPDLFLEQHPTYNNRVDLDVVAIQFAVETSKIIVRLDPRMRSSGAIPPEGRVFTRKPTILEVAKGELLTARGRSYKVLNVVPPQDIEGVGHLVGWIELAADPVEPPPANGTPEAKANKSP